MQKAGPSHPSFLAQVFIEQLLYHLTHALLDAETKAVNKVDKNPCLHRAYSLVGETKGERDKEEKYSRYLTGDKGQGEG